MFDFHLLIVDWYKQNKRDLPWRNTNNPYKIWLSEIILQQTRVDQGLAYYERFVNQFPNITDLANASEQEVLKLWQGLGYYSRARNLHASAKIIVNNYEGIFPQSYDTIIKLKGIGPYTAAAIASFAFNESKAVLDGNVYRVLSRIFDIEIPIDSSQGMRFFNELAQSLIPQIDPATYNQAIMEFGALKCVPQNPTCETCPFNDRCLSLERKSVMQRPVKTVKIKIKKRYFNYLIYKHEEDIIIQQRKIKDIWQHLFEFPLIETETSRVLDKNELGNLTPIFVSEEIKHILSHQHIYARFYHFNAIPKQLSKDWIKIKLNELHHFPFPKLIENYIQNFTLYLS